MKQKIDLQLLATLGGGILFSYLFWMEKQAINLLIYTIFILIILVADQEKQKTLKSYFSGSALLLAAIINVVNHSFLTVFTWYVCLAVFIGFVHFQMLRSIFTVLLAAFLQFVTAPVNLIKKITATHFGSVTLKPPLKIFKYIIIPFMAIVLFSVLYSAANSIFAGYVEQIANSIGSFLNRIFGFLFEDLSLPRLMHLLFGIVVSAGIFISLKGLDLEHGEARCKEQLTREGRKIKHNTIGRELMALFAGSLMKRMMALKTENIIGIISFTALNLLLLALNAIDVSTIWLDKNTNSNGAHFSAELHDGTNVLILSIVMAMLVIVYFFNGNLNFYRKNKTIRLLAYLWIAQNMFLVLSVLFRDFNYIGAYGLTYKRIGVMVFLLLCTIGLVTAYLKVATLKTFFYLCKVNGFIWYILLLTFGFVNWDVFIVRYNINNKASISLDLDHLMSLSDKTLPLLDQHKLDLRKYLPNSRYTYQLQYDSTTYTHKKVPLHYPEQVAAFEKSLTKRIKRFKNKYAETSWLSWNYRDWQTQQYLIKNQL
uniref:DUF4153 domain-containing protein n=1 Tax=Pedobacter schmidteae TaxID=2201271 RepID=UPI0013CF12D6|nr:DUF4173 domain-containing protein [Pedobacter schmidteae]